MIHTAVVGVCEYRLSTDLHIEPLGDAYRLIWRNRPDGDPTPGEIAFEGVGFPTGDRSMVLTY